MGNPVLFSNHSRPLFRYGGGGGGRVFLRYQQLECGNYDAIIAYGGPSNGGVRGLIGGAGTITHFVIRENATAVGLEMEMKMLFLSSLLLLLIHNNNT